MGGEGYSFSMWQTLQMWQMLSKCILPHLSRTCSDKMGWRDDMFKNIILMAHEWALMGESGKNNPPTNGDE